MTDAVNSAINDLTDLKLQKDTAAITEGQATPVEGNLLANDDLGSSAGTGLYSVNGTLLPVTADLMVMGRYGTLLVNKLGDYTYRAGGDNADNVPDGVKVTDDFTYTVKASNNILATQKLSVLVTGTAVGDVIGQPVVLSDSDISVNTVAENAAIGTVVGVTALGVDADAGTTVTYALTNNAGGKFAIDAQSGVVTVAGALDFEAASSQVITVKATSSDGSVASSDFTIAVTNVNDNPAVLSDSNPLANTVAENSPVGTVVGVTALGVDADAGTTVTYALTNNAG
ncbi:MAG: cadherin repeat domain-containing protein, partial [Ilumatobacteraceae bacterium]|nr:cadherin repeat domain-containing protein [Ilumatobacteraceae bacterium]